MEIRPLDTDAHSWELQKDVVRRLDGEARLRVALDLSNAVREIHLAGLRARNATASERALIRPFVRDAHGVTLRSAQ
jgi:hypothetical protein